MPDRILTHHISAYHALQGTADDLRWCPYGPGDVWVEDTPSGRAAT